MPAPIRLIYNPSAGAGRAARKLPAVEAELSRLGVSFHTAATSCIEDGERLALEAQAAGEIPVVLSGDGLIGRVASALRGRDAVMGLLPGGRGNDLARALGIPLDPVAACAVVARGVAQTLDLGEVEGRAFACVASYGFDSGVTELANRTKLIRGSAVYAYAALRALAAWHPARFELELDGARAAFVGFSVALANSRAYGGGMLVAPDARLDDGLLDVIVIGDIPKLRALPVLARVFRGTHVALPCVHVFRVREARVSADRPFRLFADGEPIADTPTTVRALPRAIRMLVPS